MYFVCIFCMYLVFFVRADLGASVDIVVWLLFTTQHVKFDYIIRQFQNLQSHVKMYLHGKNSFPLTSSFLQSKSHQNRHWKCHQKIHYFQSRTAFSVLKSLQNLMKMYLHGSHSYPLQKIFSGSEGFFFQRQPYKVVLIVGALSWQFQMIQIHCRRCHRRRCPYPYFFWLWAKPTTMRRKCRHPPQVKRSTLKSRGPPYLPFDLSLASWDSFFLPVRRESK